MARHGRRPAAIEGERVVTYAALGAHAGAVAAELVRRGVSPGDRVAIFLERGADAVAAYFGALAAGCIATIVNDRLRPRQIEYVLAHASARALVTSAEMLARQPRAIERAATTLDIAGVPPDGVFEPVPVAGGEIAQLIYTSGSTGLPKGVAFSSASLWAGIEAVTGYLGITPDDRVASVLPFSSVYGLNQLLGTVYAGATLVVERSPVPHQIAARLRAAGVTVLAAVPPLWLQLLAAPAFGTEPIPSLRVLQSAGGHLPTDAVRRLRRAQPHARLFLQYGMTETFRSTFLDPGEVDHRPGSMGKAMEGAELLVVRDDLSECASGEVGELVCRGPAVAAGYWNDPEATARVFRPWPAAGAGGRAVFSGDLVRRDEDGFLHYVGRRDRMIKSLGFRIGPDEVVDVLFASGEVLEAVVTTEPDDRRGERIVACVVLAPGGCAERLARFCGAELPRHMQPARVDVRTEIPRLPSGKYDLHALGAPEPASGSPHSR